MLRQLRRAIAIASIGVFAACSSTRADITNNEADGGGISSCASQGAELAAACPAGTRAELDANQTTCPPGVTEIRDDKGQVQGTCVVRNSCRIACKQDLGCACGLRQRSKDEYVCATPCTQCGNGAVEEGEECDLGMSNGKAGSPCSGECKSLAKNGCTVEGATRCLSSSVLERCVGTVWIETKDCAASKAYCGIDPIAMIPACIPTCPTSGEKWCGTACVNTSTDPLHCGMCNTSAPSDPGDPNSKGACESGTAKIACKEPFDRRCGSPLRCVDIDSDPANCGGCGTSCTNANGSTSCSAGLCSPVCLPGFDSCDANRNNGCETNIRTDTNCGACGIACSGTTKCAAVGTTFKCATCEERGQKTCSGVCRDAQTDPNNCGECGRVCPAGVCTGGACTTCRVTGTALTVGDSFVYPLTCPWLTPGTSVRVSLQANLSATSSYGGKGWISVVMFTDADPSGTNCTATLGSSSWTVGGTISGDCTRVVPSSGTIKVGVAKTACQHEPGATYCQPILNSYTFKVEKL